MINFPVLKELHVDGYGLYPGPDGGPTGLHVDLLPGLTLVLGANGLGKSTLVWILYRLLTGPYDIPGLITRSDLGSMKLETTEITSSLKKMLGQRVADDARSAVAKLTLSIGKRQFTIERRLSDLALLRFAIDGKEQPLQEKESFQHQVLLAVGVWSFGDWVLLLRHLTFYFEDRRALVWDASAQRQVLRFLFLPVDVARKWTEDERAILELDSRMRNLQSALTREERALLSNEARSDQAVDVRGELKTLQPLQDIDRAQLEKLEDELPELDAMRQHARLRQLKAEQDRESHFRELERARLMAISARFPNRSETGRFILAQLMTEAHCVVCNHDAPDAASHYAVRLDHKHCVVCDTDLSEETDIVPEVDVADKRAARAETDFEKSEEELANATRSAEEAAMAFDSAVTEIHEANTRIADRTWRIQSLVHRLPPAEADMHQQRSELATMRGRVEAQRKLLVEKRKAFREFVDGVTIDLASKSEKIKERFDFFAHGFLLEDCNLVWSPQPASVGQSGETIDFPGFELEMTGAAFTSPVRRSGPEQVSESQREFIDLAFRMALMDVAGENSGGTLIIDAPEASLDAVFVTRAADVLSRFAAPDGQNRLLITSNLVEGSLIPSLISRSIKDTERSKRIVDLLSIAAPTAAVREMRGEYDRIKASILAAAAA